MYGNCFTFNTSKVGSHVSGTGPYNGTIRLITQRRRILKKVVGITQVKKILQGNNSVSPK